MCVPVCDYQCYIAINGMHVHSFLIHTQTCIITSAMHEHVCVHKQPHDLGNEWALGRYCGSMLSMRISQGITVL